MNNILKLFCGFFLLILVLFPANLWAEVSVTTNTKSVVQVDLEGVPWRYHSGDDLKWAEVDFDDSGWDELTKPHFKLDKLPKSGWTGVGWFRTHLKVSKDLLNKPLQWQLSQYGASEIYLDGKQLFKFGQIGTQTDLEQRYCPKEQINPVVFTNTEEHVIAIRYSSQNYTTLSKIKRKSIQNSYEIGVYTKILDLQRELEKQNELNHFLLPIIAIFAGGLILMGLIHLLLFLFYRQARENLWYALFIDAWGSLYILLLLNIIFASNLDFITYVTALAPDIFSLLAFFFLAFLYTVFYNQIPRIFRIFSLSYLIIDLLVWVDLLPVGILGLGLFVVGLESIKVVLIAIWQKKRNAWLLAIGMFSLPILIVLVNVITPDMNNKETFFTKLLIIITLVLGIHSFPLTVSIYLARTFARTNKQLEEKLTEIKDLSAKQLEQERREAELTLEREKEQARVALLEAENERKEKELEEARFLQLSLLPKHLPQLPNLEIAVYLKPASEVGGDYYDFDLSKDGVLTVAIGDATGHGLRAGTLVTATKGLFNILASEADIPTILRQSSLALKKMNFRSLFMAMTILKIKDNHVRLSCAGMPPLIIYRASEKILEAITLNAMPLGGITFPYKQKEFDVNTGDTLLLMSDGFPEQFNSQGDILGYDEAQAAFGRVCHLSPTEIIDALVAVKDSWAKDVIQNDDITFIVLKIK